MNRNVEKILDTLWIEREVLKMKGFQKMLDSIDYIENNLENNLVIASIACLSKFHFQRMFSMLTGYTVSEYIRNRRITLAVAELMNPTSKVIDVAFKYGYESPVAFTKAFYKIHRMNPSEVKKHSRSLKAYPRLSFQLQLKGDVEMDYKIVKKEDFTVVGKSINIPTIDGTHNQKIASFWNESNRNGFVHELDKVASSLGTVGICLADNNKLESITYLIGVEKSNEDELNQFDEMVIPSANWAVFPVYGAMPDAMHKAWKKFLPSGFHQQAMNIRVGLKWKCI